MNDKERFERYMLKKNAPPVIVPNPKEPEFCKNIKNFIKTRGDDRATPEQIMYAHNLFQEHCVEKPSEAEDKTEKKEQPNINAAESEVDSSQKEKDSPDLNSLTSDSEQKTVPFEPIDLSELGRPKLNGSPVLKETKKDSNSTGKILIVAGIVLISVLAYFVIRKNNGYVQGN